MEMGWPSYPALRPPLFPRTTPPPPPPTPSPLSWQPPTSCSARCRTWSWCSRVQMASSVRSAQPHPHLQSHSQSRLHPQRRPRPQFSAHPHPLCVPTFSTQLHPHSPGAFKWEQNPLLYALIFGGSLINLLSLPFFAWRYKRRLLNAQLAERRRFYGGQLLRSKWVQRTIPRLQVLAYLLWLIGCLYLLTNLLTSSCLLIYFITSSAAWQRRLPTGLRRSRLITA